MNSPTVDPAASTKADGNLRWVSILGAILFIAGLVLRDFASPSPHGFIEIMAALPMHMAGVFFLVFPPIVARFPNRQWVGALLALALAPILGLATFVGIAWVLPDLI